MFTLMKIREGLASNDYKDPGEYKHPQGTVAYEVANSSAPAPQRNGPATQPNAPGPRKSSLEATIRDIEQRLSRMLKRTRLVAAVGVFLTSIGAVLATHIAMPRPASAHEDHGHFSAGQPG